MDKAGLMTWETPVKCQETFLCWGWGKRLSNTGIGTQSGGESPSLEIPGNIFKKTSSGWPSLEQGLAPEISHSQHQHQQNLLFCRSGQTPCACQQFSPTSEWTGCYMGPAPEPINILIENRAPSLPGRQEALSHRLSAQGSLGHLDSKLEVPLQGVHLDPP